MNYKKLKIWQKSNQLALDIYKITSSFPKEEMYGIISQLRRAALSVPTNIVEGYARKGDKELNRFINISLGSLAEVEYLLDFSRELNYLNNKDYLQLKETREEVGRLLWSFYKKTKNA
jgi:four helix bundle protein